MKEHYGSQKANIAYQKDLRRHRVDAKRGRILSSAATAFAALSLAGCGNYLDPPGYCAAQNRVLSDDELLRLAVLRELDQIDIDGSEGSISNFLSSNPNCCRVNRDPASRTLLDVLTRNHYFEVELNFPVKADRQQRFGKYYHVYVSILPCGTVAGSQGIGTDRLESASAK
jgi:hypothetical protein